MKQFKRFCWLLAWSVWLWLGFGLHRELPRHAGAKVCEAQFEDGEQPLGFFDNDRLLATLEVLDESKGFIVRVRDAVRGEVKSRFSVGRIHSAYEQQFSSTHAVIVGSQTRDESRPLAALDLHTGRWIELGQNTAYFRSFHPTKPWALLTQPGDGHFAPTSAAVVDLRSGRCLFEWHGNRTAGDERKLQQTPIFLPPGDTLLAPVVVNNENSNASEHRVEVWTIGAATGPDREIAGLSFGENPSASHTGRVAWAEIGYEPTVVRVFDLAAGKIILTHPPDARPLHNYIFMGEPPEAKISTDGRAAFYNEALVRVADGKTLWERASCEWPAGVDERGRFHVQELWGNLVGNWATGHETTAVRELATGRVLCRMWSGDSYPTPIRKTSVAERHPIYVDDKNVIRNWPTANWPLLALCQTILALPLVLLWALLRWRAARRQPAVASLPPVQP